MLTKKYPKSLSVVKYMRTCWKKFGPRVTNFRELKPV